MNKTELVTRIARKQPHLTKKDAALAVDLILSLIQKKVAQVNRIEIRGFGTFTLRYRVSRERLNLKTGKVIFYPAGRAMHFKPAQELRLRVNSAPAGMLEKPPANPKSTTSTQTNPASSSRDRAKNIAYRTGVTR
jgi:integration host factor subunit beta